jgi:hypothetical protein
MEESAQNTFEYFCAAAFNFGVRRTARIVHEVQIASKFRIPGIFLTYIGNRMNNQQSSAVFCCLVGRTQSEKGEVLSRL